MKTTTTILEEITSLQSEGVLIKDELNSGVKMLPAKRRSLQKRITAINKRILFLKSCKAYVETQPSPEFLKKEEERLSKRLKLIDKELLEKFKDNKISKEAKAEHNKIWGTTKIKSHLKNIQFLLG
jgi:hypothetical protein